MDYHMFVSKEKGIGSDFSPLNLVDVDSKFKNSIKLEAEANQKWLELKNDALAQGYTIEAESGYRSYDYQKQVLQELIIEKGSDYASKAVAMPGHSEHQTGLALDYCILRNNNFIIEKEMDNSEECIYINSIAHKYGFIIRYPEGKEEITGYMYEPWHLRYVGSALAEYLYTNKLTLDEYCKEEHNEKS